MTIDERGRGLWGRISPSRRTAFLSCFITGYLVHLYAFTNLIPNSDGLSRVFDAQQMTISGRWFLHYASAPNSFTQMPAVIGFLSMLFLSLAAVLVVDLLGIRSTVLSGLSGALIAAFPCMGYTFLYMFTASAYCLAILLAVLSVWLARKGRVGFLLAVAALALSMGTYQAYVTVAIGLSLLVVLREALTPGTSFHDTLSLGLRLMAYLAAGAVVYYIILLIFLKVKNLQLLSYLGMDAASEGYPFAQLPRLLFTAYKQVVAFFFVPGSANAFLSPWMVVLDLAAVVLGLVLFIFRLRGDELWKEHWRPLTALGMIALLPLGINFGQIISPYSEPTPLMKYAYVTVFLAVVVLADLNDGLELYGGLHLVPAAAGWMALVLLFCLNTNNLLYTASAQAHRATDSYLTRMMTRVESCPGYEPGMEVAIIGAIPTDQLQSQIESYGRIDHYSVPISNVTQLNKHLYYYLNDWLNIPITEPSEEVMLNVSKSAAFRDMPLYPDEGSIQVLKGRLVVKLQEEYTPKSDFEIAYEGRR